MAHFAELDENNKIIQVIVVNNDVITEAGIELEEKGIAFCKSLFGEKTQWKQTSYNNNIRKNFAGIGYTYDAIRDAFIPPKSFDSWILDEKTCHWKAPVLMPEDGNFYGWSEKLVSWIPKPDSGLWEWDETTESWKEYNRE